VKSEVRATLIAATALVALYLLAAMFPGSLNWGFHFLGFLSWQYAVIYVAVAIWIAVFVVTGSPEDLTGRIAGIFSTSPVRFLAGTVVTLVAFGVLLRVQAPLLGDSFYLLKNYLESSRGTSPLFPRDEPLATYYFSSLLGILGATTFKDYLRAFLAADLLLGIGYALNVMLIVRNLFRETTNQFLAFVFLLALPCSQLFLGYVETYPVVLFALSLYLAVAAAFFKEKISFAFLPPAFLLMALSHYLSGLLLGSLLYATYYAWRKKQINRIIGGYVLAGGALFLLLLLAGFDIQRFSSWVPYSHFLSFTESADPLVSYAQAYTLFSPYHFVDLFNLAILLAPFSLYMIWKSAFTASRRKEAPSPQSFLLIAILPVFAFLFFVKFDLGAARDWDVFAPYTLPAGLLAALMYFTGEDSGRVRSAVAIILVTLLNSFFFFLVNSDSHASVSRYRSFFDRRVLSQNGYYGGSLQLAMYYREMKHHAEPLRIWEAYVDEFPDDDRGYQNIVQNLVRGKNDAEILGVYQKWYLHDRENATMMREFKQFAISSGNRNFAAGDLTAAGTYYAVTLRLDPSDPRACNNLGSVFAEQREYAKAITMFTRAIGIDSLYADALHNIGDAYIDSGAREKGISYLRRAARLGHKEAQTNLTQLHLTW